MKYIKTEITIAAQPETVWNVLMNFDQYKKWNPFIQTIEGEAAIGEILSVQIQPPEGKNMIFKPTVLKATPNEELRWLGKFLIKGIFDGEHYFKLEKQPSNTTKLIHGERFSGFLIGLMGKTLDKTKNGFRQMNEALKKECEGKDSSHTKI